MRRPEVTKYTSEITEARQKKGVGKKNKWEERARKLWPRNSVLRPFSCLYSALIRSP